MTALFKPIKRMLSPRENDRGRGPEDVQPAPETTLSGGVSGQQRSSNNDSMVVDNLIYSEPTPLDRVAPHRNSGTGADDPPLPPRSPSSVAKHADEHETYYQAPVDTLGRSSIDQQLLRSSTRERAQERERRIMDIHEKTLNQKAQQGAGANPIFQQVVSGHRRTKSGGHLIDNAEYSTPWDVQEEHHRRSSGAPQKPSRRHKPSKPIPGTPNDGSDNIIPVSPTPILSSSHERSQSASPIPPHSPILSAPEPEYDDPWDVKNRKINQVIPSQHGRHHGHSLHERRSPPPSQLASEHRPHTRQSLSSRVDHSRSHLEEVRPTRAMSDHNHHHRSTGLIETTTDPFRGRTATDIIHGHSISHSNPSSPRTSSVSMPTHPIQKRPLPVEPGTSGTASTTAGVVSSPLSSSNTPRADTSPSTWFDSNLALEEQP